MTRAIAENPGWRSAWHGWDAEEASVEPLRSAWGAAPVLLRAKAARPALPTARSAVANVRDNGYGTRVA